MKKFFALFCGLASLVMMTSCWDDDTERSIDLSGAWDGYFGMYYECYDRHGKLHQYDSEYSELEFLPDYNYATHGIGHEVDYYDYGPYDYQYYFFYWEIRDGVISLSYPHAHDLDVDLYDYHLSSRLLTGRFKSGTRFELDKYKDYYYGWHNDYCRYGCDDYDWWYSHGSVTWSWKSEYREPLDDDEATRSVEASSADESVPAITRVGRHI